MGPNYHRPMADRWTLSRAGILNVYQYGDEILRFSGGRLLLRGVNGSGKSTAMNMLLPFLIEADVRRIDAAGEQTGVLRSWMLSGRDEQQPVGYLWIEFERGDEHLVCGCGIRANQSTQKATTWWFVTPRRPGIDLQLVAGRVPLNVEQLRNELGHHAVFTQDQRSAYRTKIRADLFGGADIDQHLRLLHIVRSPRVGDRIDSDLTAYLNDALPQLSDEAIDDAARPLQNLEEHRRAVAALAATAEALDGLCDVYRSYAATETRRHASAALALVGEARACKRRERSAKDAERRGEEARSDALEVVKNLDADLERLAAEIEGLKEQPAYREGARLEHLRARVSALARLIDEAHQQVALRLDQLESARDSVRRAAEESGSDLRNLVDALSDVAALAAGQGLGAHRIDVPTVTTHLLDDDLTTSDQTTTDHDLEVPSAELTTEGLSAATSNLLGAVAARRADLDQVRRLLAEVQTAEQSLSESERALESALVAADTAEHRSAAARAALESTTTEFTERLRSWVSEANELVAPGDSGPAAVALATLSDPTVGVDVVAARAQLIDQLAEVVDDYSESLRTEASTIGARRTIDVDRVDELSAELERLRSLPEPDVPNAPWQQREGIALGQLVEFAENVDTDEQLGYEAALEASGLLGATVHGGGAELRHGELVVTATSTPVEQPLAAVLTVVVPEELQGRVDAGLVRRVLESISTDAGGTGAHSMVAADGSFRFGVLRGRHVRTELALVGAAARFAALQRQIAAIVAERAAAQSAVDRHDAELVVITKRLQANRSLRNALPATRELDRALDKSEQADQEAAAATELTATRRAERDAAEATVSNAAEVLRRAAATAHLPFTSDGLDQTSEALTALADRTRAVEGLSTALTRSTAAWIRSGNAHVSAVAEVHRARTTLELRIAEHQPLAMTLATAEDALGVDYDEIVAAIERSTAEHEQAKAALPDARATAEQRVEELARLKAATATAQGASAAAERAAGDELPRLRRMLAVPGFVDALRPPGEEQLPVPVVTESADGVAELATALLSGVPEPVSPATAESVRQSLRQRRDRLGVNWDAGDRQPDETLPCEVEVTGPLGQGRMPLVTATVAVHEQLDNLTSLLTAQQDQALRNLLQGLIAKEVSSKLHAARELVALMNQRLAQVSTAHGISARLRWTRRNDLDDSLQSIVTLMSTTPDLRTEAEDATLAAALSSRLDEARRADPDAPYDQLIGQVLDYRQWHEMAVMLERPGRSPERLTRRTALSEGEKKVVSYLPLFAAVAASCDALAESDPTAPRFVLLDDAFAKVSEDNHPKLFGLLVDLDLDFIATSERLWGTYSTVPGLAITEVVRDARSGVILLEHARWDGAVQTAR